MALLKEYLIQDATNNMWYTENHEIPIGDRWSTNILSAYRFATIADAESELDLEYHIQH